MIQTISLNIYFAILIDRNKTSTACQTSSAVLQLPHKKPEQIGQSVTLNNCLRWLLIKRIRSYPAGQRERSRVTSQHWAGRAGGAAGLQLVPLERTAAHQCSKTLVQFSPLALLRTMLGAGSSQRKAVVPASEKPVFLISNTADVHGKHISEILLLLHTQEGPL